MERTEMIETAKTLAATMGRLSDALESEVAALYTSRPKELESMYRQKTLLLAEYAASLAALKGHDKGQQPDLPAEINAELKQNATRLADSMKRNMHGLSVAREASEQVVNVIIEAVRKQRHHGAAYGVGKDGSMIVAEPPPTAAQAVTFDARL